MVNDKESRKNTSLTVQSWWIIWSSVLATQCITLEWPLRLHHRFPLSLQFPVPVSATVVASFLIRVDIVSHVWMWMQMQIQIHHHQSCANLATVKDGYSVIFAEAKRLTSKLKTSVYTVDVPLAEQLDMFSVRSARSSNVLRFQISMINSHINWIELNSSSHFFLYSQFPIPNALIDSALHCKVPSFFLQLFSEELINFIYLWYCNSCDDSEICKF